jgi:intergrase/recombinase
VKIIKDYVDHIDEEIEGAKDYAEKYVEHKVKDDMQAASRYKEMANDELKHAMYVHEMATKEIDKLSKVYTPPAEMMEKWEKAHKEYVERVAWVKQMLAM